MKKEPAAKLIAEAIKSGEIEIICSGEKRSLRVSLKLSPDRFHELISLIDRLNEEIPA